MNWKPLSLFTSILIIIFIPALLAFNYVANHFYVHGAITQDSVYFAALVTASTKWPMPNPSWLPGSYFSTHFCLVFYPISFFYVLLQKIGITILPPLYLAATHGVWHSLMGISVFGLLWSQIHKWKYQLLPLLILISLAAAMNGISLASMGMPHFEIGIPALLLLFFFFQLNNYRRASWITLLIGVLMREDAGFHYFGVFFLLALCLSLPCYPQNVKASRNNYIWYAVFCFLVSTVTLIIQKNVVPPFGMLEMIYTGTPPYAHLSADFFAERIPFLFENRLYILIPLFISLLWAIISRDWLLSIGTLSVIPWIIFSVISHSKNPGYLTSYYAFPIILIIGWPAVSAKMHQYFNMPGHKISGTSLTAILSFVSIIFLPGATFLHDERPWESFGFGWYGKVNTTTEKIKEFYDANKYRKGLILDDPAIGILPNDVTPEHRRYEFVSIQGDENLVDTLLYLSSPRWDGRAKEYIHKNQMLYQCSIKGTDYLVASKLEMDADCNPAKGEPERNDPILSLAIKEKNGWYGVAEGGRWTRGRDVYLPPIKNIFSSGIGQGEFCIDGYAVLPDTETEIRTHIALWGHYGFLGEVVFSSANANGLYCITFDTSFLKDDETILAHLQIDGYSANTVQQHVDEMQKFGIFIRAIRLKKK